MGGERTRAHSWSGAALEGFCSAVPPACAPGSSGGRAVAAKNSVCNHETLHSGASRGERCARVPEANRRALRRHCLRARAGGAGMAPGSGGFGASGHTCAKREKGDLRSPATAPGTIGVRPLTSGARATGGICFFAEKNTEALHGAGDSGQSDEVAGDTAAREGTRPKICHAAGRVYEGVGTEKRNARPGRVYRVSGLLRSGWGSGELGRRRADRRGAIDDRPWSEGPGVSAGVSVACEQPRLSGNREVPCVRIPGGANERGRSRGAVSYPGRAAVFIEDIVMEPAVKRQDVRQIMPKLPPAGKEDRAPQGDWQDAQLFPAAAEPAKIFSRIADWAEEFHPPSPEPLTLSPSALSGYRTCPQRYLFGYLWSLREGPKAAMSFGAVMHTTIKRFVDQLRKGVKLPFEEVQRILETEWNSKGFEDEYQEQEYKKDGLEQLRAFHAGMMEEPPETLAQEKAFELPLDNDVIIKGRIDQINSLGNKRDVEIVDYKTGRPKKDVDARKDLQLSLYALAAKEILELNPARLVFHYLQNNQRQETTRDAKQLDEAQKVVQEVAGDIRAGEFPAKRGFVCRNCAYKPICPAHEEALSA